MRGRGEVLNPARELSMSVYPSDKRARAETDTMKDAEVT